MENHILMIQEVIEHQRQMSAILALDWQNNVFSVQWWFLGIVTVGSWIIWWKYVDKERLPEIILYGFIIFTLSSTMNEFGVERTLWWYPVKFIPVFTRMVIVSMVVIPVSFMLTYQYLKGWKSYTLGVIILSAIIAFVLQPFLKWFSIYLPLSWPYTYAFLSSIVIGLFSRWLLLKIMGGETVANEDMAERRNFSRVIKPAVSKPFIKENIERK